MGIYVYIQQYMPHSPNPFTPNSPIDPQFFAGRSDEVFKVQAALNQTRHGNTQHILLTGERGIGKTSLAIFARYMAQEPNIILGTDFRFATAYYTVERGQSLIDVCQGLTSKLLSQVDKGLAQSCVDKLKGLNLHFGIHVPGVGEIKVDPKETSEVKARLYADFENAIKEAWDELRNTYNGILLVVDELHNLENFEGAGSFFKVVSEAWAVDGYRNAMFAAIGLPEVPIKIAQDDPSAPRVFSYVELKRMTLQECLDILNSRVAKSNKTFEPHAAADIAKWSGGFPYFLHQLAYDAFEKDTDNIIGDEDVLSGLLASLVQFERMAFGDLYKSVEGKQKQKIVDELSRAFASPRTATDLGKSLKVKNVHQYLKSLQKAGIVENVKSRYRLSSELLSIYVQLQISAAGGRTGLESVSKYPAGAGNSEPSQDPSPRKGNPNKFPDSSRGSGE